MRYTSISQWITRTALEDIDLDSCVLRAGEPVTVHIGVANRDRLPRDDKNSLDIARTDVQHLSFGQGVHICLGQQLARMMLRLSYRHVFDRFPGLRLAVPSSEIIMRNRSVIYGVQSLPVTW